MLTAITLAGCNRCDDVDPPNSSLAFLLVSPTSQNLIGRSTSQYHPDSIRISYQGVAADFTVYNESVAGPGSVVELRPVGFDGKSDARLFIRLNRMDTDTLDITYTIKESKCFDVFRYNSVFYNGLRMGQDGNGFYRLIKR